MRVLAAISVSLPAHAEDKTMKEGFFFKPYVGLEYQRTSVDYKTAGEEDYSPDILNGGSFIVGARVHKNLGLELSYNRSAEEEKDFTVLNRQGETSVRLSGFAADALAYVPVYQPMGIELIATAGVTRIKGERSIEIQGQQVLDYDDSEWGFRVGGGAQIRVVDSLNFRTLARYQTTDFDGAVDHAWVINTGLNYGF